MMKIGDMWMRDAAELPGTYIKQTGSGFEIEHLTAALTLCKSETWPWMQLLITEAGRDI